MAPQRRRDRAAISLVLLRLLARHRRHLSTISTLSTLSTPTFASASVMEEETQHLAAVLNFKNTHDDHDRYFPFSPMTIRAIEKKWIQPSDAVALQAPINILMDFYFHRGNFGRSAINAPLSFRALMSERKPQHTSYLDRQIFKRDLHELCSATEIESHFGWADYALPGLQRICAPELRPSIFNGGRLPIWQKLSFNPRSHIDVKTRTDTNPNPRAIISAAQCERIHHQACTRSSRNPLKITDEERHSEFQERIRDWYGSSHNIRKCCKSNPHRLVHMATRPCETNRSHFVSTTSNLDLMKKTKDNKFLKHFFLISHDATSRSRDIMRNINEKRHQADVPLAEVETMVPISVDIFLGESFGDWQRAIQDHKVSTIIKNKHEWELLTLSPDFNDFLDEMENPDAIFRLAPPLPNASQIHMGACWLIFLIHNKVLPRTFLDDDDRNSQRASFEPGVRKKREKQGQTD